MADAAAAEQQLRDAARRGDADELASLLQQPGAVNVNAADAETGVTALHEAVCAGHEAAAALLLAAGADVAAATLREFGPLPAGSRPLHFAAAKGHAALVSNLLARGADAGAVDSDENTPLCGAVIGGHVGAVAALLDTGVRADAVCSHREQTALHMAAMLGQHAVVALLLDRGAAGVVNVKDGFGNAPLHACLARGLQGTHAVVELLLAAGADVNAADEWHCRTPLHVAAAGRAGAEVMRALLDAGAAVEAEDDEGRRPLHLAAQRGHMDGVAVLLGRGADVRARDADGATPLHLACGRPFVFSRRAAEMIGLLLQAGADVNAADAGGRRPAHCLAGMFAPERQVDWRDQETVREFMEGAIEMADEAVAALKRAGADFGAVDAAGCTPLMLAADAAPNNPAIVALLRGGARFGPHECATCVDLDAQRVALRSLTISAAAEAARLQREREAWRKERAALEAAREAAAGVSSGGKSGAACGD